MIDVVAIDGPGASGKSTTAKMVAQALGYMHLDTGAMYRAVTYACMQRSILAEDTSAVLELLDGMEIRFSRASTGEQRLILNGDDVSQEIRTPEVSRMVSAYSALPIVREKMLVIQREIGLRQSVICEGRDIGTRVFPDSKYKFFLNASIEERAKRRFLELQAKGFDQSLESIVEELKRRDYLDSTRSHSPLKQADDALVVDTSDMTIQEQVDFVVNHINRRGLP